MAAPRPPLFDRFVLAALQAAPPGTSVVTIHLALLSLTGISAAVKSASERSGGGGNSDKEKATPKKWEATIQITIEANGGIAFATNVESFCFPDAGSCRRQTFSHAVIFVGFLTSMSLQTSSARSPSSKRTAISSLYGNPTT